MSPDWQDHYASLTPESYKSIQCLSRALRTHPATHALIGGWPIFAMGSPVPSVDTDLVIPKKHRKTLNDFTTRNCGLTLDDPLPSQRYVDTIPLDEHFDLFPLRAGESRVPPRFDPRVLTDPANSRAKTFDVEGVACTFNVPETPYLAFSKLCALWGRRRAWEARTRPALMGAYLEAHRARIYDEPAAYWLRKAGKDVFDLAFLLQFTTLERVLTVADRFGLRPLLQAGLTHVPPPIQDWAQGVATRHERNLDFSAFH